MVLQRASVTKGARQMSDVRQDMSIVLSKEPSPEAKRVCHALDNAMERLNNIENSNETRMESEGKEAIRKEYKDFHREFMSGAPKDILDGKKLNDIVTAITEGREDLKTLKTWLRTKAKFKS